VDDVTPALVGRVAAVVAGHDVVEAQSIERVVVAEVAAALGIVADSGCMGVAAVHQPIAAEPAQRSGADQTERVGDFGGGDGEELASDGGRWESGERLEDRAMILAVVV